MRIRKLDECDEFIAGDGTRLRELLHPDKDYEFDGRYSLAHATVAPDEKSRPHILASSSLARAAVLDYHLTLSASSMPK